MANADHLSKLMQGEDVWNKWRRKNPEVKPDLSGAHLTGALLSSARLVGADLRGSLLRNARLNGATLRGADLSGANLTSARLRSADLSGATLFNTRLRGALLIDADLRGTDLKGANLSRANLRNVNFNKANLQGTNLSDADMLGATLSSVDLSGAIFNRATIGNTVFANLDLRVVKGLEEVQHFRPSEISVNTIHRSYGQFPEEFLRGCGLRDWEVEATKLYRTDLSRNQIIELTYKIIELRADPLIRFNSCFISYSSKDEEFARRLYTDLQDSGVRCWFAPEDMKIGDRIRYRLDDSIRLHDKLLLVLSKASVVSQWIEQEVATALEKERERECEVLFPVRLDDMVLNLRSDWPALIKNTRHIGDFSNWANPSDYKKAFTRLLNDLRIED